MDKTIFDYVDKKFPSISKDAWQKVQDQLEEAMKLEILYTIFDQLSDIERESVRIDIREDVEYDSRNYEFTKKIMKMFEKHDYKMKEEWDYDHPVLFLEKVSDHSNCKDGGSKTCSYKNVIKDMTKEEKDFYDEMIIKAENTIISNLFK